MECTSWKTETYKTLYVCHFRATYQYLRIDVFPVIKTDVFPVISTMIYLEVLTMC